MQTSTLKGRESIAEHSDPFLCSLWLSHSHISAQSFPQNSRLRKGEGRKESLKRLWVAAGTEAEPALSNWINVFEVAPTHSALPLLPLGLAGTAPIPAASQTLRALQCPDSSPNKQQILGCCSTVILCSFVEHVQTVVTTWDQYPQQDPHTLQRWKLNLCCLLYSRHKLRICPSLVWISFSKTKTLGQDCPPTKTGTLVPKNA